MSNRIWKTSFGFVAALAWVAGAALSASASVIVTPHYNNVSSATGSNIFVVLNNDLLQSQSSVPNAWGDFGTPGANYKNDAQEGSDGMAKLTDGDFGENVPSTPHNYPDAVCFNNTGDFALYTLNTSVNTLGYTITGINTYGGSDDSGRDRQNYKVSYSTVSDPDTFIEITTVSANPPGNPSPSNTEVLLTSSTGVLATGVKKLLFQFDNQENGFAYYREIDVVGSPTPEPATMALLGLGAVGMIIRRSRKS